MGITNFDTVAARLGASRRSLDNNRYTYTSFNEPLTFHAVAGSGAAATTDAAHNTLRVGHAAFQCISVGAFLGTAPQVTKAAAGVLIKVDALDNKGYAINPGYITDTGGTLYTEGSGIFVAGTDEAFVKVKLKITTVANADFIAVGFRKVEAFQADLTGYADYFFLNVDNGTIKTLTEVGGGGTTTTSTTQTVADGGTVTLEVRVNSSRIARGFVNGALPTVEPAAAYTFTNALKLVPELHIQEDVTALDPGVTLLEWESGTFDQRGLRNIIDLDN